MDAVRRSGAGDKVDFDTKVRAGFEKRCVCRFREDPYGLAYTSRSRPSAHISGSVTRRS